MNDIKEYIDAFDEELVFTGKPYLTLIAANNVLIKKGLIDKTLSSKNVLKDLLVSGKIPHAIHTETKPRQWRIPHSNPAYQDEMLREAEILKKEYSSTKPPIKKVESNKKSNWKYWLFGFIGLLFIQSMFKEFNNMTESNSEVKTQPAQFYQSEPNDNHNEININQFSDKVFTWKSTLNDKEINGEIIQTNHETSYHTFDFINKTVTQKSILNSQWITITYPMNGFYEQKGLLATTFVITVNDLGVNEIWFSPDVPNLGYDYSDGSRIACYELTLEE